MAECDDCGKHTMHLQQSPTHVLHLILSVITLGLWIPVWVLISMDSGPRQCTVCGSSPSGKGFALFAVAAVIFAAWIVIGGY
jgi:hypothetical protein